MKKELIFGVIGVVIIISFLILIIFKSLPKKNTNPSSKKPINEKKLPTKDNQKITLSETAKHNKSKNCWLVIDKSVYDVTNFIEKHPGGADKIIPLCGKNATEAFKTRGGKGPHKSESFQKLQQFKIGDFKDE